METDRITERIIAAVDMGSSKISLGVALVEGNNTKILFHRSLPSDGVVGSEVINPTKAKTVLGKLIRQAEEELSIKIKQAVVALPKCNIRKMDATGTMSRSNPEDCICEEEVNATKDLAEVKLEEQISNKERIYGAIAQSFSTDDYIQQIENDIIGMTGETLTGNFKVFIGRNTPVTNLTRMFNELGIGIARFYFAPLASARAVLTEDETNNGIGLIDFGAGSTSISIFKKKVLIDYYGIPFGAGNITGDINLECGLTETLAENLKKAHGGCLTESLTSINDKTLQIETEDQSPYIQVPVNYLSEIITAREREIIDAMLYEIQRSGTTRDLRRGLVITGGGSEMLNLTALVKEMSGYMVKKGAPRHKFVATGNESIFKSDSCVLAGMILLARDENINCGLYEAIEETHEEQTEAIPVMPGDDTGNSIDTDSTETPDTEKTGEIPAAETGTPEPKREEKQEKEEKEEKPKKEGMFERWKKSFTLKISNINNEINKENKI